MSTQTLSQRQPEMETATTTATNTNTTMENKTKNKKKHSSRSKQKSSSRPTRRSRGSSDNPTSTLSPLLTLAILLPALYFLYSLNPTDSNPLHPFLFLSYKLPPSSSSSSSTTLPPQQYGKGPLDLLPILTTTVLLTLLRQTLVNSLLLPLASLLGIRSQRTTSRFAEQMYVAVYIGLLAGPWGLWCMDRLSLFSYSSSSSSPSSFSLPGVNMTELYSTYPNHTHEAGVKGYYLFQAGFWCHQVVVMILGLEGRRKDFKELVAHHAVTVMLVGLSYRFHFTVIGVVVFVSHDLSDFFLAISKSLNYIDSPLQGPSFAFCIMAWTYLRHYVNLRILYSLLPIIGEFSTVGPYELDWEKGQFKCPLSNVITVSLLAGLQGLNLFWLGCLLRSAYRFIFLGVAKDDREDDEEVVEEKGDKTSVLRDEKGFGQ